MTEENKEIIAYKGFGSDWKCRGYQYEIGKTYEHEGKVEACESGSHSCENPLDVLAYYDISSGSKYALVKASGEISRNDNSDTKIASSKITIEVELNIHELLKSGFEWVMNKIFAKHKQALNDRSTAATSGDLSTAATSGYRSTAATSGDLSTAATSGYRSTAATSGDLSTAATSGDLSIAATSGYRSTAATSGDLSTAATSGDLSTAATSGYRSTAATSGDLSTAATSGYLSTAATSGDLSTAATSGYRSTAATSGDLSTAATSGDLSTAATSGNQSTAATSGYRSTAIASGKNSVAIAFGSEAKSKAVDGSAIVCCYFDNSGELIHICASKVGENGIKPDTWYTLNEDGEFIEVNDERD